MWTWIGQSAPVSGAKSRTRLWRHISRSMRCMWWKPALSSADVLWSSGLRVMEPSSQTIRVSWRIAALPPSIAPWAPLGSPPSRSTPSHRDSRAAFGGMFSPAPAVLGARVCSKTSIVVKTPDSRSARAVMRPAMPPPAMSARIKSSSSLHGWQQHPPSATVARSYPIGKLRLALASPDQDRPSALRDVRVRRAALRGVRDDLLRERDELIDEGVGDVAPADDRQRARRGVDERHVGDLRPRVVPGDD